MKNLSLRINDKEYQYEEFNRMPLDDESKALANRVFYKHDDNHVRNLIESMLTNNGIEFERLVGGLSKTESLKALLELNATDGKVWIEESGRDCDGVVYAGKLIQIEATVEAYNELYETTNKWADGPFHFSVLTEEEADEIEYQSKDTFAERTGY